MRFAKQNGSFVGQPTTADDPQRAIWYSCRCSYWTDDFDALKTMRDEPGGIPCCPQCGCGGFITTAEEWFGGAKEFEDRGHPRYLEWLNNKKGKCMGRGTSTLAEYERWMREKSGEDAT